MREFLKEIKEKILIFDGSKGVMLQRLGMKGGECPELWNVEHSEEVKSIYLSYKNAGADVIQTNTFQGNRKVLEKYSLQDRTYELNYTGARLAREVMGKNGFVAASIGPIGKLFEPSGELTFDVAYEVFKEQIKAVVDGGVDIINFETFTDLAEMRAALLAAKDLTDLPVICSIAFEANGKTLMGTDPVTAGIVLKSLGADMIGSNCSFGPEHMLEVARKMYEVGGISLSVKPNAGLPEIVDGKTLYKESPEKFAELSKEFVKYNVRLIGGCCGTTPEFIKSIKDSIDIVEAPKIYNKSEFVITSGVKLLNLDKSEKINIGQINANEDNELSNELKNGNLDFIIDKALDLSDEDFEAIYINVDAVDGTAKLLADVVNTAQGYIKEPFIIETANIEALEQTLRLYRGKAGVIVDNFAIEEMEGLLSVAKRYGSTIIDSRKLKK